MQKIVNAKSDSHKREEKTQWAFSGRLICGSCGRFFNVRNRNLNPIWFCPSAKQNNGKSICHAESVYEEQIVRVIRRAVIERFQLSSAPIRDDVSVADIMSGRYAENTDFLTHEADDFVIQMQARLENLQKIDFMERDRCFYSVHWFDDTRTKVEMDSNIEDFRNTASYYDGQVMRDNAYRKRFIK